MDTFNRLISIFSSVFEDDIDLNTVTVDSDLYNDIGINSIGLLYMAMAIEEEFNIKFVNDDFAEIKTISDVIKIIEKKVS